MSFPAGKVIVSFEALVVGADACIGLVSLVVRRDQNVCASTTCINNDCLWQQCRNTVVDLALLAVYSGDANQQV